MGGSVSDRQWRDVLGVLKVQGPVLDHAYLTRVAASLGLVDIFVGALSESGAVWVGRRKIWFSRSERGETS